MLCFMTYIFSFIQIIKRSSIQIDQGVEIQRTKFFPPYFQLILAALFIIVLIIQAGGSLVRKRKVYKKKVVISNSVIKGCHEFHLRSHKDLEMLKLAAPILLPRKGIL